nr:tetraacyldisaccharide 4'-kinase [Jiella mangrovi]
MLRPAAAIYGAIARHNLETGRRARFDVPVLCVGNFVAGGGGKTPTSLALADAALALGRRPAFVSRGHGRRGRAAVIVDPSRHTLRDVGDEPLLLAALAPTAVSADRASALRLLMAEREVDFIIMDDGFQSQRLKIDHTLIALDARRGIGNGRVIPAGPLRAPLIDQIRRADALLVIGEGENRLEPLRAMARAGKPIFEARLVPKSRQILIGERLLAFAGIADPGKFYASLEELGAEIVATRDFPDHHAFSDSDCDDLAAKAAQEGLILATTAKDAVRLETGSEAARAFRKDCAVVDVALQFSDPSVSERIIKQTLAAYERRRWQISPKS